MQDFPWAEKIGNTQYYYSYHRSGCADMNWDSYINNYKKVKIGNISGQECDGTGTKNGPYINKIMGEKRKELAKLPIHTIKQYKEYKWGFIKLYWYKNYKEVLVLNVWSSYFKSPTLLKSVMVFPS